MRTTLVGVALFGLLCVPLYAQDTPVVEVYGGYQLLYSAVTLGPTDLKLHGFTAAVEGNFNSRIGIVGEFGLGMKTINELATIDLKAASLLAGPRFSHRTDKVRLFAHALFGLQRVSNTVTFLNNPITEIQTNGFGTAIGGGFEFAILEGVMIRPVQLDYIGVRTSTGGVSSWETGVRYTAGLVLRFGSKG